MWIIKYMSNVISFNTKREYKSERLRHVVGLVLAQNQSIIVGTSKPQERYNELKEMFPDAELEFTKTGIKIWKNLKSKQ